MSLDTKFLVAILIEVLIVMVAFLMHLAEWDTVKWLFVWIAFILGCYIHWLYSKLNKDNDNYYGK